VPSRTSSTTAGSTCRDIYAAGVRTGSEFLFAGHELPAVREVMRGWKATCTSSSWAADDALLAMASYTARYLLTGVILRWQLGAQHGATPGGRSAALMPGLQAWRSNSPIAGACCLCERNWSD
jgi:hypothetical protein